MVEMIVRSFTDADRDPLLELFTRAGAGSPTGELWGHPASEAAVYLTPYMELEPGSLFLAQTDRGLVGYLTGCLDSFAFPSESERLDGAIRAFGLMRDRRAIRFFARATKDMIGAKIRSEPTADGDLADPRWPAHLHINVAEEARGTGAADQLMASWFERLAGNDSPGCHLQTVVENTRAVRFFERMGFAKHGPTPLVPGLRHEGHRLRQQTMTRP